MRTAKQNKIECVLINGIHRITKEEMFDILCRGGRTVKEHRYFFRQKFLNDKEARAFHSEQRKSVPKAFPCETLESKVDYPIHYDQFESGMDHFLEQRRLTCGLVLQGVKAERDHEHRAAL